VPPVTGTSGLAPQNQSPPDQTPHALARQERYATFRAFYDGDQWLEEPKPGNQRVTINYCAVLVDKMASYLFGKPVSFDAHPRHSQGDQADRAAGRQVEEYLQEVAEDNDLAGLDLDNEISTAMLGDGAYTCRWDPAANMPRITAVDPSGLEARWRSNDPRSLLWVRQSYYMAVGELTAGQRARWNAAGQPGPQDPYAPLVAQEDWTATGWQLTFHGVHVDGGPNPYDVVPYAVYPNLRKPGETWGISDLDHILELQTNLNESLSVFRQILLIAGNPVVVIEGADEEDTSTLRLGPNQLWTLPKDAKAYVLELLKSGAVTAHLEYTDKLYRALHDIAEMPRTSFGDTQGQAATSGVALEIELQPLLHKLIRKRTIRASALRQRAHLTLAIARLHGHDLPDVSLTTIWPAVLPQDRTAVVDQETALVAAGIHPPTKAMTILEDLDPEETFKQVVEQSKALAESRRTPQPLLTAPGPTRANTKTAPRGKQGASM